MHAVQWRTSLIAWANDAGVKVYDTASHQRITFIERVPHANLMRPQLVWQACPCSSPTSSLCIFLLIVISF